MSMAIKRVWVGLVLCWGCAAQSPVDREPAQVGVDSLASNLTVSDDVRAKLEARIDATRLALGPREPVVQGGFDGAALVQELSASTGTTWVASSSDGLWQADDQKLQITMDTASGRVELEGGAAYDDSLAHASDGVLMASAKRLFAAIAADSSAADTVVRHLGATTIDIETNAIDEGQRMGSKVFAFRKLGGLRVAGNRLVASYLNDGTLRALRGLWPTIDLSASRLESSLSQADVIARAVSTLAAGGVNPDRSDPIVLESFYEVRSDAKGTYVVLRGSALVRTYGADDAPSRIERHDFDL